MSLERVPVFDEELIKKLALEQEPLVVKDGVMQIDPTHPDYDFWMED